MMLTYPVYPTLHALHRGEVLELDGLRLVKDEGELKPGDLYVAGRNTGPHLLTVQEISEQYGCVYATTKAYPFDIGECIKVRETE